MKRRSKVVGYLGDIGSCHGYLANKALQPTAVGRFSFGRGYENGLSGLHLELTLSGGG